MTIYALDGVAPELGEAVWVAPDANVIGNVRLKAGASVWFGATLRGDNEPIEVGEGTNVQEDCVFHTDPGFPMTIGADCVIGHKAMLHGCTIGAGTLIGMGATVLNGAKIGEGCLIGAGALVTEGKEIPAGSLVMGAPGRVVRALDAAAQAAIRATALKYQQNAQRFASGLTEVTV
ncbi:gamma carbonic anhydrase family protein [Poseidonocella sedimentorum]|uniref:Carbonic anhydrase or acetyltransferase, isoleucine patch superfamily n=1 Tax=Poseidonocella sedimentorum TaxID=871652 RepID=A0A1I6DGI9_9RHOB|nr:gamma carbonic anhydrase family protein [Poseidonocella sedimentorum]SFR04536.1 Carbonic anhydrase or acetyltransferase, isoleucine patch superfamily [Poseidonocella sedimentorum]